MLGVAVVADDLSGANDTGVALAETGLKCFSVDPVVVDDVFLARLAGVAHAIVLNTDTRSLPSEVARVRVQDAYQRLKSFRPRLWSKRIDSTLRGNVGSEIEAALEVLPSQHVAIVVPAYPAAGRVTVGGYQLVNGVPLERSQAARDPQTPVRWSFVPEILASQTPLKTGLRGL